MEIMKILSVSNVIYEKYLPFHRTTVFGGTMEIMKILSVSGYLSFHRTTVFGGTMEIMKILGVNSGIKDDILLS